MISRRGLFKMLGAVAASPVLKPLSKMLPETYTTYLMGTDALVSYNVRYTFGPRPGYTRRLRKIAQPFYSGNKMEVPIIYGRKSE